ncbi:MAG: CTP synthase [Eubacteriales bacterium]|nr:CTP synthase [Eubacteriales bacterium]MDD4133522.1 CTP synthase [Eubacteriales bacterium]
MGAKYIFVTGGVVSSLGKGITAASLGRLLKCRGLRVTMLKLDPYINVDPGTMSPYQHGEVFVTEDGAETDLDLGHYERFIDENLSRHANATSGQILQTVISRERQGGYLGATVQIIPHVTDEIKSRISSATLAAQADVAIVEVGGTVGDIESQPFLEAIRQFRHEVAREDSLLIHVTLLPYLSKAGEIKTKPTQHSVRELGSLGLQPDILVCRSEAPVPDTLREKIGMFCNVLPERVFLNPDLDSIYEVPLRLHDEGLDRVACQLMNLPELPCDLSTWEMMTKRERACTGRLRVALVGKYVALPDAYLSVAEALNHAGLSLGRQIEIDWVDAEALEKGDADTRLSGAQGIIVPGGFGSRGLVGKMAALRYAREHGIPLLGLCLGMQMAVIEYARHVLGLMDANTTEVDPGTGNPVIALMEDQNLGQLGGTMRLGAYDCAITPGSLAARLYQSELVRERHRHRYEFNNAYRLRFEAAGMRFSGWNPQRGLAEIIELPGHPFFMAVQFHPEFRSRPDRPHPLFVGFLSAIPPQDS